MSERKPHDLFISYAQGDRAWVEGYLLDALTQAGVRCHSEAAFELGAPRLLEFERAVQQSQRTLLVLSPAYLAEGFAQFTDLLAQTYGVETRTWPVIPLMLQAVSLPPRLSMLVALDATDPGRWEEAIACLCATLQRPAPGPAPQPPCPYPGMVPFSEQDAANFFGRENEVAELRQRLRHQNYLFVIGPSGCGKSSLLFAGLIPELRQQEPGKWWVVTLRPGPAPLQALAQAMGCPPPSSTGGWVESVGGMLAGHPPAQRLLLIVDQLEELFTQASKKDAGAFIEVLKSLQGVQDCALVLSMRADFYQDLMNSDLWPVPPAQRLEIAPLRGDALRQAIARPAERLGVHLEAGLLERLLADARDEPGVLPAVQETMALLWEHMARRVLPLSAYERLGHDGRSGLAVALATKADATLAALSPTQEAIARRIFLRLVQFGEGRLDTRRQQPVATLRSAGDDPGEFDRTLEHLTGNRLLTLGGEEKGEGRKADIAHETLIAGWPALQDWLRERRDAERTRRRLEAKAEEWLRLGQGNAGLLDEVELLEAQRWLESADAAELGCSPALPALVQASRRAIEQEKAQQRRAARFRQLATAAIGVLIIGVLTILLWSVRRDAESKSVLLEQQESARATAEAFGVKQLDLAREEAAARAEAEAERQRAQEQARIARAGELAAQAQVVLDKYPQRSLLLALESLKVTADTGKPRIAAAEDALRQALANCGGRVLGGHQGPIHAVAISHDSHWLVTGSGDGTARLWDLTAPDPAAAPIVLRGLEYEGSILEVSISPDDHWLVTGTSDGTARLWDLTAPNPAAAPIILGDGDYEHGITAVAISPDGHWLTTCSLDGRARLWDLSALDPAATPIALGDRDYEHSIRAIATSPDGRWLVTGSDDGTVGLWDLTAPDPGAAPIVLGHYERGITAVAISPDGRWLVTGSDDGTARLWDRTAPDPAAWPIVLRGHKGPIRTLTISPDNHWLVTGSWNEGTARLWNLSAADPAAAPIALRGHERQINDLAISPDSHWLVTSGEDNTARLWDLTAPDPPAAPIALRGHDGWINAVAISPDGHWLVTGSSDNTARLWDLTALQTAATPIVLRGHNGEISVIAISPDNHWLVTGSRFDDAALLWDLTAPQMAASPIILRSHEGGSFDVAISPDSHWLVTRRWYGYTALLWDLTAADPSAATIVLRGHERGISAMAISPDSHWLATGSEDTTARLWDLTAVDPAASPIVLRGHEDEISAMAISPDNHWLVTGSWDTTARLWNLTAPDPAAAPIVLRGHELWIYTVVISPDSHWLVTGNPLFTEMALLWDLTAPDLAAVPTVLRGHDSSITAVAISPDSHSLVTGSDDQTARLWDLTAADPAAAPIVLRGHEDDIYDVAISPDSHWLATGCRSGIARLWDLTAPDPAAAPIVLRGHQGWISAMAITPDGRWLVTGGEDNVARLWNLRLTELVELACRTAQRNLTRAEWEQYFPGEPYHKTCAQWPEGN